MDQWHYARDGKQYGPVLLSDLRRLVANGDLTRDDLVWRAGMQNWAAASTVTELASAFAAMGISPLTPPQLPTGAGVGATASSMEVNVPAGHWARIGAALLDSIVLFAVQFVIGMLWGIVGDPGSGAPLATGLFVGAAYYVILQASDRMATLGKQAVGLIVVDRNGDRMSTGQSLGRYLVLSLTSLFTLPLLVILFSKKHRGLHDMAAGTVVVRKSTYDRSCFDFERIEAPRESGAVVALVLVCAMVPVIGILAAIAIPAYQDYTVRGKVASVLSQAATHKPAIAGYLVAHDFGQLTSYEDIGVDQAYVTTGGLAEVDFNEEGEILVAFRFSPLAGKTLHLTPVADGARVQWRCWSEDAPAKYLPASCR